MNSRIGCSDLLDPLEMDDRIFPGENLQDESGNSFPPAKKRLCQLIGLRNCLRARDAQNIIESCSSIVLRSGAKIVYNLGDIVDPFNPDSGNGRRTSLSLERGRLI